MNCEPASPRLTFVLQYKFRVMSASIAGISEASPESEEVSSGTGGHTGKGSCP